ncbi:hypothetical protein SAMN06298216_1124 [Spirosomataceae bacterium TFI 002]|nr:hypothetical protein SAMN06298216_1124 [Spirosomataceae bacterium TFI 002]
MIIFKNIPLPKINGITLWPFILIKSKQPGKVLINHEMIHIRQQVELLVFFFYIIYFLEWSYHFARTFNFWEAYRCISFEKEAYLNEHNLDYLKTRKWYASFKLFKF